jgi:hypothetical protein
MVDIQHKINVLAPKLVKVPKLAILDRVRYERTLPTPFRAVPIPFCKQLIQLFASFI